MGLIYLYIRDIPCKLRRKNFLVNTLLEAGIVIVSGVPRGGLEGFNPPPPEIPKAFQNRAKLNPIVKTDKNG